MTQTWQSHHLPRLEVSDLDGGDVVVCGSFAGRAPALAQLPPDRVAFAAPLERRSDLEWLLRGLLLHPRVRHLVLCGDDRRGEGEALVALWKEGLDEAGCVPGSRGRLASELGAEVVDTIRRYVALSDLRDRPVDRVAGEIADLAAAPPEREAQELPPPAIPERKVFLSRKTTFPIFAASVADSWLQLLNLCLRIGIDRQDEQGARVAEALNPVVTVGLPVIAEDLEVEDYEEAGEFAEFLDFNQADFQRYYRFFKAASPSESAPGLVSTHFEEVDGQLFGSFVLRSVDVYDDWPLQALALVQQHREEAARRGLAAGASTFVIHAARLAEGDWARAEQVLGDHFKRPLPLQVDHSGIFLFGNDRGRARAMLLDHDAGDIYWEEAFDTTEELSWYIVDAMPWLLPQHVRYVGQECSTLKRAIREGECYEQG